MSEQPMTLASLPAEAAIAQWQLHRFGYIPVNLDRRYADFCRRLAEARA